MALIAQSSYKPYYQPICPKENGYLSVSRLATDDGEGKGLMPSVDLRSAMGTICIVQTHTKETGISPPPYKASHAIII